MSDCSKPGSKGCAEQLARFFPQALPVRLRMQVTRGSLGQRKAARSGDGGIRQRQTAPFSSALPLEFDDRVRLEREGKSRKAEATVIAVQYHEGEKRLP